MKKILSILVLFLAIGTQGQTTYSINAPLKLNMVNAGTLSDSVLVRGADKIVKYIPSSEFGANPIPFLEYDGSTKTVWNNGKSNIDSNTSFGDSALKANTTGSHNTAVGTGSLGDNTTGQYNTAVGNSVLESNTTGIYNTGIGGMVLSANTIGNYNAAVGITSLYSNISGSYNSAFGEGSLASNTTGFNNSAFGGNALGLHPSGDRNSALGYGALENIEFGDDNVAMGYNAAWARQTINKSILIGSGAEVLDDNQTNQIVIGYNAIGNGTNSVTIGNEETSNNYFYGDLFAGSFVRYGYNGKNILLDDGNVISPNLNVDTYYLTSTGGGDPSGNIPIWQPITGFAPINNPTFTGTVTGIDKTMVGLGNVDNTADVNKPVSTATQSALNTKTTLSAVNAQNLSSFAPTTSAQLAGVISNETGTGDLVFNTAPTFSGIVSLGTATCNTLNASTGILVSAGISPQNKSITIDNTDNTSTVSGATFRATTGGALAGDPSYAMSITSNTSYSCRLANTDADKYKEAFDLTGAAPFRIVTTAGETTMPLQPSFSAYKSAATTNTTGDGTAYTVISNTEIYDQNADYNNTTGTFTAPVTGKYMFICNTSLVSISGTYTILRLNTSSRNYKIANVNNNSADPSGELIINGTVVADMSAGDTATMVVTVSGGAKTTGVFGGTSPTTFFQGYLIH